jgi:hypothetical protein
MIGVEAAWVGFVVVTLAAAVFSVLPRLSPVVRAVPAAVIVLGALALTAFGVRPEPPSTVLGTLAALSVALLGIVAGSAVTNAALRLSTRTTIPAGTHGGILVVASSGPAARGATATGATPTTKEVLRGGAAIGDLERFAVIGAAAIGHLELIAAVIAIKGLGRFSELDSAEARERFIVGTLTSMLWAGAAAAAVLLP